MKKQASKDSKGKAAPAALKVVAGPEGGDGDGDGSIDFEAVRVLARIAAEFDLAEIEADRDGYVRVRRGGVEAAVSAPGLAARPIALSPPAPVEGAAEKDGSFISSPFVGTFYRAPSPEAPVFVEAGQQIRKGQVVCIVEAMKLMNEIEAEAEGKIAEILVQNGEHVEYGQHLFRLAKT